MRSNLATALRLEVTRKTSKLKSATAEVNMTSSLVKRQENSVDAIQENLLNAKKQYFERKRTEKLEELALSSKEVIET